MGHARDIRDSRGYRWRTTDHVRLPAWNATGRWWVGSGMPHDLSAVRDCSHTAHLRRLDDVRRLCGLRGRGLLNLLGDDDRTGPHTRGTVRSRWGEPASVDSRMIGVSLRARGHAGVRTPGDVHPV